jgi:hypothetical protein
MGGDDMDRTEIRAELNRDTRELRPGDRLTTEQLDIEILLRDLDRTDSLVATR